MDIDHIIKSRQKSLANKEKDLTLLTKARTELASRQIWPDRTYASELSFMSDQTKTLELKITSMKKEIAHWNTIAELLNRQE